jgi:Cupredoxin-like domain
MRLLPWASVAVVVLLAFGVSFYFYQSGLTKTTGQSHSSSNPGCAKQAGGFLIIASDTGFNDSESHIVADPSVPYPVITVPLGSNVTITVCNQSQVETHGFAILHYFPVGRTLTPGYSFTLTFVAKQAGTFSMYCNVLCPVHEFMLQGELVVQK